MPGYAGAYAKISLGEAVRYTNAKQAEAKEILQRLDHIVKVKDAQADPEILEAFAYFEKEIFSQQTRALVSTVISILAKRCGLENENGEVHLGKPMDQWIKEHQNDQVSLREIRNASDEAADELEKIAKEGRRKILKGSPENIQGYEFNAVAYFEKEAFTMRYRPIHDAVALINRRNVK